MLNYLVTKLESGLITFINAVTLANRDYPYHDYKHVDEDCTDTKYMVGANQLHGHGDQRKPFVSKSTLIFATENVTVYLNSINNVAIDILADTWYEFKSNIYQVFWIYSGQAETWDIYFYFEGVLSNEQRGAE
jgi:hypothetical protein